LHARYLRRFHTWRSARLGSANPADWGDSPLKSISCSTPPSDDLVLKLCHSRNRASAERFLNRHRAVIHPDVVTRLAQIVVETIRKDTRKAMLLAETGVLIARRSRRPDCIATALRAKANALYGLGRNREAVKFHRQAIKIFTALKMWKEAARSLSGSIQPHILLGQYSEAIEASERARAIFLRLGEDWRLARLEINVGNISHRQDRFEEAFKCYERAYNGLLPHHDAEGLGIVLSNMAVCLVCMNDFERALGTYEKARAVFEQNDMSLMVAQLDYNTAYLYYLRGDYNTAIEKLYATKQAFAQSGDLYHFGLCHMDLSEIYLELNLNEDAESTAHKAFVQFRELKTNYEVAKSLINEAIALARQGKIPEALKQFKKASKRFEAEQNRIWLRLIELYRAVILFQQGRYAEAHRYCGGAAAFFDQVGLPAKAVLADLLLARIALQRKDLDTASKHIDEALVRLKRFDSSELESQAQSLRGEVAQARGDTRSAYAAYREALRHLENLRSHLNNEDFKIAFMKNRLEVYELLISLCMNTGSAGQEEAFGYIEAAKSRNMMERISTGGSRPSRPASTRTGVFQRIQSVRQDLNWYHHRINIEQLESKENTSRRVDRLRKKAKSLETEFLRLLGELPPAQRATAVGGVPVNYSLAEIQNSIDVDCTILDYFATGNQLVAAVVTQKDLHVIPVAHVDVVQDLMNRLQFQLGKFQFNKNESLRHEGPLLQAVHSGLASLYDQLIEPLRSLLNTSHLVVAPHGLLHYLPFHALRIGNKYLSDLMTISYAPSATVFSQCQQKSSKEIRSSLIMGIPDKVAPEIETEVKTIAGIVPDPSLFVGPGAAASVLRDLGPKVDLIHISTHGQFRRDNPMFSNIQLGDGPLTLYDLYDMQLDSALVALSGCSTGMNVIAPGDELLGLQRGLLYAGASSMLLSLWDVNDRTTSELMAAFFRRLTKVKQAALALQGAMQEIRSRYAHPYFWAPFMLVGRYAFS
jgi:CHAT domain-containing protein/predicted negative regulator of RcsB-dependent stress response